jgi:hypothetical protein
MIKENTEIQAMAERYHVGTEIVSALLRYVVHRVETGGFLYAVLCGDLYGAVNRADLQNRARLSDIVWLIYNEVPSSAFGSPEKVNQWLAHRGEGS